MECSWKALTLIGKQNIEEVGQADPSQKGYNVWRRKRNQPHSLANYVSRLGEKSVILT